MFALVVKCWVGGGQYFVVEILNVWYFDLPIIIAEGHILVNLHSWNMGYERHSSPGVEHTYTYEKLKLNKACSSSWIKLNHLPCCLLLISQMSCVFWFSNQKVGLFFSFYSFLSFSRQRLVDKSHRKWTWSSYRCTI